MKKMKRLLVFVLAGVLALAMLTACGGMTVGQKFEKEYIDRINTLRGDDPVANDTELRAKALELLKSVEIDEKGMVATASATKKEPAGENSQIIAVVLSEDPETDTQEKVVAYEITSEKLEKVLEKLDLKDEKIINGIKTMKRIGVVPMERNGKLYGAAAAEYPNKTE